MAKIIDPDLLERATGGTDTPGSSDVGTSGNVYINVTMKWINLGAYNSLSTDGVTMQALYSYLKEEWKSDANLIKYPFPMVAITPEQFEFVDGWQPGDQSTVNLFRDGGFAVKNTNGTSSSEFAGIITLGTLGGSDQVYYQQTLDGTATSVVLTGAVNQCVKVFGHSAYERISFVAATDTISSDLPITTFGPGDVITVSDSISNNGDYTIATIAPDYLSMTVVETGTLTDEDNSAKIIGTDPQIDILADARSKFDIFVREQAKLYAKSKLADIGVSTFTYQAYRFPLANSADLKITHTDVEIDADTNGVADVAPYSDMAITYYGAPVSRTIGGSSYNFDVVIDADVAQDGGLPTAEEIYEFVQWSLRQSDTVDIDAGGGIVVGKTADELLKFVGDTLVTETGVFIDRFSDTDINRIEFYDNTGTKRTFPFVAAGAINFNQNLVDDSGAVYRMFFTDANGNNFGDNDALLVQGTKTITSFNIAFDAANGVTTSTEDFSEFTIGTIVQVEGSGSNDGYYKVTVVNSSQDLTIEPLDGVTTVTEPEGTEITATNVVAGDVSGSSVQFTFDYDGNIQGGRTLQTDAPVTVVAIGLDKAQYVKATSTIVKSNANSVSLVASLERNYANPA